MYKNWSAKYYQVNKDRLQKNACDRCQSLSKEEKKKRNNMVVKDTKLSKKMKKKVAVYRKEYIKWEKMSHYNHKNKNV